MVVPPLPDLTTLSHAQKAASIAAPWEQVVSSTARLTASEQRLNEPAKTPDTSLVPPSKGQKPNRFDTSRTAGPRKGSLGRKGGGRSMLAEPDQVVSQGGRVPALRHGPGRGGSSPRQPSRHDRTAAGPPRGDARGTPRRTPLVLRRHDPGARAGRDGAGLALRSEHRGDGAVPALHPRHQRPAPVPPVRASVRARHRRGRARRPVPPRQAGLRRRHGGRLGPAAPVADRVLGQDERAGRWADLLEPGVPDRAGGGPRRAQKLGAPARWPR